MSEPHEKSGFDNEHDAREAARMEIAQKCVHAVRDIILHHSPSTPEETRFIELDVILILLQAVCHDARTEMVVREFLLEDKNHPHEH